MFNKEKFSARLRELRKKNGETQDTLAELLGVKSNQISEMELGKKTTSLERLCILCDHFKVSADYLLGQSDDPGPYKEEVN